MYILTNFKISTVYKMFEHILALLATVTILLCFIVNIEVEILNFIHYEFKLIFNHVDDINVQGKHTVATILIHF